MTQSDFVTRGQALVTSGQYQEAVKVCRLGLLGRPTTVEGRIVLGQALLALKRFDEVLAEMRVALELDHSSIPAQILKGEAMLRKGDTAGAIELFTRVRPLAPAHPQLMQLIAEAQRAQGRPVMSASHPAVGFVGSDVSTSESTKHYPNHGADEEDTDTKAEDEDTGGSYTRPTSLAAPGSMKRSSRQQAMPAPSPSTVMPSPAVLAVGDRSGTVEVDPEADGVELDGDEDFGELAAPPPSRSFPAHAQVERGSVRSAARGAAPRRSPKRPELDVSSVELDSHDMIELDETPAPRRAVPPGPGTAVRNAVKMPAGPIDLPPPSAATRPTALGQPAVQPPLAHTLAQHPHAMQMSPLPLPQPPRGPIAAAMPTAVAQPMPLPPTGAASMTQTMSPGNSPGVPGNVARPAVALDLAQQQSAAAVDRAFGNEPPQRPGPAWAHSTVVAGSANQAAVAAPDEATRQPAGIDPRIAAETPPAMAFAESGSTSGSKPLKTGMRRGRSRLQVAMWIFVGAVVIGGGVFAGFQIRAMRLGKQIAAARNQAVDVAKADTWQGWAKARNQLAGIARASSTVANRAALARSRAVLAYEFGDGLAEAKAALDKLGTTGGLDTAVAATYVALAEHDPQAARSAADRATELAPNDAAVLYVSGQAALIRGDYKAAIASLRSAQEKEPRPLYAVGLARAIAATGAWDDALGAVDSALGAMPDHPAALIERALLLTASGKISSGNPLTVEVRTQLLKLVSEGGSPFEEQPRGVSPAQVALANLALAQVDFALRDVKGAYAALKAAAEVRADEQRFGEEAIDTLYSLNLLDNAAIAATAALKSWPASRRALISQAQVVLAQGNPTEAIALLGKNPEAAGLPRGLAVRGHAKLLTGDVDGARSDFDAALKKLPLLELALVGRAWVDLQDGNIEEARKRIEPTFNPATSSVALTTVYAAILRSSQDVAAREKAKQLLEKAVAGPPTVDVGRAQLELGRTFRDLNELRAARTAYAEASKHGSTEARLESGLLLIEDRDPSGGRDTIDALIKEAGDAAGWKLLLEGARARSLVGDHAGATQLLEQVEKIASFERWHHDRERGRILFRKGDTTAAGRVFLKALDTSGKDVETFLLAADVVTADPTNQTQLAARLEQLLPERLAGLPEQMIVRGKLAIAANNLAEAETAYRAASKELEKATPRRAAQAAYGLAVIAFNKQDDPTAKVQLDIVLATDPTIYSAYLYKASLSSTKPGDAFDFAQKATTFNPDSVSAWALYGSFATRLGKSKARAEAISKLAALAPGSQELADLKALR